MTKANMRGWAVLLGVWASMAATPLLAAPPLTTIQDTMYRADGSLYSGYVQIEWKSFEASDSSLVPAQSLSLRVYNGLFRTLLVPTTNASAGAIYTVRYVSDGRIHAVENWAVPPATVAVRLTAVRVPPGTSVQQPGNTGNPPVAIGDVVGLQEALDVRPRKGSGYAPGRTAVINGLGEIESALGADSDCITVEGAGTVCGPAGGSISFIDGDILTGNLDGTNGVFNLAHPPNPVASLLIYRNGLLQRASVDFNLTGATVTFLNGAIPRAGDIVIASYRLSGTGSAAPQILCSSVGSASSAATATSLGNCTIPANVLHSGERVEISADFTHEGTAKAFTIATKWGASTLTSNAMLATETNVAVRISLGVHTSNTVFGSQSWGASTAAAFGAGAITASYSTPLTVDFLGNLATGGGDGITLRSYTVIRYPAP